MDSYKDSLSIAYNKIKNPGIWGSVTKAVVFNPHDKRFVITSVEGKAYFTALEKNRVVGAFDNNINFIDFWDECEFVFYLFYPGKPFRYTRAL